MEIITDKGDKEVQYDLFTKSKARSERDMWLDEFVTKINASRLDTKYPPIKCGQVIGMVKKKFGYADTYTLRGLYDACKEFHNFSKGFFYLTRKDR